MTVVGEAGVGKSRLAAEFLATVAGRAVVGRCLPYGEGISYWPVLEVLKQLDSLPSDAAAEASLRSLLGESEEATSAEEIAWAFRKLLEEQAKEEPLVCLFDDLQWAEETFLNLVEHVALLSSDAPVLLLCLARPGLVERQPQWPLTLRLEPLLEQDVENLIAGRVPDDQREQIAQASAGNPLFVTEMLAMARQGGGEVVVPPTLRALLAARLDQLETAERSVLERGAVEGEIFHRGAVQALAPDEQQLTPRLASLVRKELIRPDKPLLPADDAFRFRHLLIRDAAYETLPKATRAELHERYADWLEQWAGERVSEYDEIAGFHLEQAYRCLAELGLTTERRSELAEKAAERLGASGRRAFARGDMPAAVSLLERATALLPSEDTRSLRVLPSLGRALTEQGQLDRAEAVLSQAIESGRAAGEQGVAADALVARIYVHLNTDPESSHESVRRELRGPTRAFEALHDEGGLARALGLAGVLRLWDGQAAAAVAEFEQAANHAHTAGDRAQEVESLRRVLTALLYGPTPVPSALERVREVTRRGRGHPRLQMKILQVRAQFEAMQGDLQAARELIAEAQSAGEELGLEMDLAASVRRSACEIELLAGDPAGAERAIRPGYEALERLGIWTHLPTVVPCFVDALCAQGRSAEAIPLIEVAARWIVGDDIEAQSELRRVRAKLLAERGEIAEAERLGREAVDLAAQSDFLDLQGDAYSDLVEVLALAGKSKEAAQALEQALERYERKGNLVMADRTRERLQAIREQAPA